MLMSKVVDDLGRATAGKEALAINAFATALRQLPTIIADNAGYDSSNLVTMLAAEHFKGNSAAGLDMDKGVVGDMNELKVRFAKSVLLASRVLFFFHQITESLKAKMHMLISAHEAAEMILRVDNIIKCAPRQRQQ